MLFPYLDRQPACVYVFYWIVQSVGTMDIPFPSISRCSSTFCALDMALLSVRRHRDRDQVVIAPLFFYFVPCAEINEGKIESRLSIRPCRLTLFNRSVFLQLNALLSFFLDPGPILAAFILAFIIGCYGHYYKIVKNGVAGYPDVGYDCLQQKKKKGKENEE